MRDGLSRLVDEVQAAGQGLVVGVITLEEHQARVAQLEAQGLAWWRARQEEELALLVASNQLLDATLERQPAISVEERWMGWWAECSECGWTAGPCDTQTEATAHGDRHELAIGEVTPDDL